MLLRLCERRMTSRPATIRRVRRLPVDGHITVEHGDTVSATEVIGRARVSPAPRVLPVAAMLGVEPESMPRYLQRQPGDYVHAGEVIASRRLLPWGSVVCQATADGRLASGSPRSGQLFIIPAQAEHELRAFIPGTVAAITPRRAVVIETTVTLLTGVAGFGGEIVGPLRVVGEGPDAPLALPESASKRGGFGPGTILVAGTATREALEAARGTRAAAVIVGRLRASLFVEFERDGRLPLVVLEAFGSGGMAPELFEALRLHDGREVSVSANERWPEVLLPLDERQTVEPLEPIRPQIGTLVRVIGDERRQLARLAALGPAYQGGPLGDAHRWVEVTWGDERKRVRPSVLEIVDA